jgi:membrane protease YdiL (CAAX protease family)
MYDQNSKGISFTAGFFMLIAFAIAGLVLASMLGGQIWTQMTGKTVQQLADGQFDPADSDAYKIFQVTNQVLGYLIPTFLTAFLLHRQPGKLLGFGHGANPAQAGLVVVILLISLVAASGLAYINHIIPIPADLRIRFEKWESDYSKQVDAIINLKTGKDYLVALFLMGLVPAICEETLFRGGLQNFLTRGTKNPLLAIIIVSLIFSSVHVSYFGFLSRFFLGIVLGYLYYYSGRLWPGILAHFLNNALALTMLYYRDQQGKPASTGADIPDMWWGLIAIPIVFSLLFFFRKISAKVNADLPTNY